jgi:hypothetical protein
MPQISKAEVWTLTTDLVHCTVRGIVKRLVSIAVRRSWTKVTVLLPNNLSRSWNSMKYRHEISAEAWKEPSSVGIDWCHAIVCYVTNAILKSPFNTEVALRCQEHVQVVSMAKVRFNHAFRSLPPFLSIGSACHVFVIRLTVAGGDCF